MQTALFPKKLRQLIRSRKRIIRASGTTRGWVQANLVILPRNEAFNFLHPQSQPCPWSSRLRRRICLFPNWLMKI